MQVSVESLGNLERRMTFSLPADRLEAQVGGRLREISRGAKIKGFRPGKVPAKVIEQRFGAQVRADVLNDLLREGFSNAVRQESLQIAGNPQIVPAQGADWTDHKGFQTDGKVYADGLHGFRYLRITLDALASDAPAAQPWGTVEIDSVSLDFTAYVGTPATYRGWFLCSDDDLNRYWYGAAYTNELVTDTFRQDDVDPRNAWTASLEGKLVLHDGAKRDRDPYVGDLAVSARTSYLTHDDTAAAARNVLADLADHQRADG